MMYNVNISGSKMRSFNPTFTSCILVILLLLFSCSVRGEPDHLGSDVHLASTATAASSNLAPSTKQQKQKQMKNVYERYLSENAVAKEEIFDNKESIRFDKENQYEFDGMIPSGMGGTLEGDYNSDEYDIDWSDVGTMPPTIMFNNSNDLGALDHCNRLAIDMCQRREPRDIIFLLDASNSVDRDFFYTKTLDAARDLICAFDPRANNQFGLILFNKEVREVVKLAPYTHQQWESQIEKIRSNDTNCCTCCTPIAEAFDLAKKVLQHRGKNQWSIVFAQTDGVPYQNTGQGMGKYSFPRMDPAMYAMEQVPKSAGNLKDIGARIMILGVQRDAKKGRPDCDYFKGIPNKRFRQGHQDKNMQCMARAGTENYSCLEMRRPPFPIVSKPVERNSFCLTPVDEIIAATLESICLPPVPRAPSVMPTRTPTVLPTSPPLPRPSKSPTKKPTGVPTRRPTDKPSKKPITFTPTFGPTLVPTARTEFSSLDLYFILDRSGSMDDYEFFCSKVPRRNHFDSPIASKSCWGILLDFTESLAAAAATIGIKYPMGWKSDWPEIKDNAGLRVSVVAFSCHRNMKTPLTHVIADHVESFPALRDALIEAYQTLGVAGGTCPSEALDAVVKSVEVTNSDARPFKSLVFLSDGLTSPKNERDTILSAKGLTIFDIPTYTIGLAVPRGMRTFGLTPEDALKQKSQLLTIAGGKENNFFSLYDDNAFATLSQVVDQISTKLINSISASEKYMKPYCGYTTKSICLSNPKYCWWDEKQELCVNFEERMSPSPTIRSASIGHQPCNWTIISNTGETKESTPLDLCSSKGNRFGCVFRNFCCWDDLSGVCTIPTSCNSECPTRTTQQDCEIQDDCCQWNPISSTCERRCLGNIESACDGLVFKSS